MLQDGIETRSLNIDSKIVLRFATTTICSIMENSATKAGWAVFRQKIPLTAFVTNLTLYVLYYLMLFYKTVSVGEQIV